MFWLKEIQLHFRNESLDLLFPTLKCHDLAKYLFVLEYQDLVLKTRTYDVQKPQKFPLPLMRWISRCQAVPDVLLKIKRQFQVNHHRICSGHLQLKSFDDLVHVLEDQG